MRILNIVETAYRGTLEEQDDTVVWLTHAMHAAGADLTVVLRGNAVGYAVAGQDASGLTFGDRRQTNPPRLEEDVAKLASDDRSTTGECVRGGMRAHQAGMDVPVQTEPHLCLTEPSKKSVVEDLFIAGDGMMPHGKA